MFPLFRSNFSWCSIFYRSIELHSKWSLVCIAKSLHDLMLVFRSFEAIPMKIRFDFSFRHMHNVQIAQHVAITKPVKISRDRKLAMLDFVQNVYYVNFCLYVCIFFPLSFAGFSYCKKFVYLFVCFCFAITNSIKTIFSFVWFLP